LVKLFTREVSVFSDTLRAEILEVQRSFPARTGTKTKAYGHFFSMPS